MSEKKTNIAGFFILFVLLTISCISTYQLFNYLVNIENRTPIYDFTVVFICFLEILFFSYFLILMVPKIRNCISSALFPVIGVILFTYILISIITVFLFNFIYTYFKFEKIFYTSIVIEGLIFFILLGFIIIFNIFKREDDNILIKEKVRTINFTVLINEIFDNFNSIKVSVPNNDLKNIEIQIKRLKEKFQYCSSFGKIDSTIQLIEEDINDYLNSLNDMIIRYNPKNPDVTRLLLENINNILKLMNKRETLLIK